MRFKIILEEDEEVGGFVASCPGLPGCFSQGEMSKRVIFYIIHLKEYWKITV
jgi:hypothetical protein